VPNLRFCTIRSRWCGWGKGAYLAPDAAERALECLKQFKAILDSFHIEPGQCVVYGTSALRSAKNGAALAEKIYDRFGLRVRIIDGLREAELIFRGVWGSVGVLEAPFKLLQPPPIRALVLDIGGGSVECSIGLVGGGQYNPPAYSVSYEAGAQRLLDTYSQIDPIPFQEQEACMAYLETTFSTLASACIVHKPTLLVGASGSFDTLRSMVKAAFNTVEVAEGKTASITYQQFERIAGLLLKATREERLALPGMHPERADMMVVAVLIIKTALLAIHGNKLIAADFPILASRWALKEGAMLELLADM
jgi:exopolyphosphatase / guanosine-5'-triphosphate,3'-diphosphate pyrophosphatase